MPKFNTQNNKAALFLEETTERKLTIHEGRSAGIARSLVPYRIGRELGENGMGAGTRL